MLMAGGVFPASNISVASRRYLFPMSINISSPVLQGGSVARRLRTYPKSSLLPPVMPSVSTGATWEAKRPQARLGGMVEDGLSYKQIFIVRGYEVGPNKTITVQNIASYLLDAAFNHVTGVDFPNLEKLKLILVLSRMHLEIYKYPTWSDVIEIETWFQIERRIGFRQCWTLKDHMTGLVIGRATGTWLLMNQETRRFHKVDSDIRDKVQKYIPKSPRGPFLDENKAWLKKIEKLDDPPHYSKHGLEARPSDIDMNDHLNNVTYIGWVLESILEVINNYELQSLTINYRKECRDHEVINSLAIRESNEIGLDDRKGNNINGSLLQFRHSLRLSSDDSETTRARTIWRKKD